MVRGKHAVLIFQCFEAVILYQLLRKVDELRGVGYFSVSLRVRVTIE